MLHYTYKDLSDQLDTIDKYPGMSAAEMERKVQGLSHFNLYSGLLPDL